jgi:hypothetical protein
MKKRKKDDIQGSAIKCCLKKYLLQKDLLPVIQQLVDHISKISHRGSLLLNHYLVWCLEQNYPLPDLEDHRFFSSMKEKGEDTPGTNRSKHLCRKHSSPIEGSVKTEHTINGLH